MPEPKFFILSIRPPFGEMCLWYRPKASGYTVDLDSAGLYTAEEVKALHIPRDLAHQVFPVPEDVARKLAVPVVSIDFRNVLQEKFAQLPR